MTKNGSLQKFLKIYQKSEVIFEEGSTGNEMYLIHSGRVSLSVRQEAGEAVALTVLNPGEFFGEMALVDTSQRSATAVAVEDSTQLLVLDKSNFLFMVRQQPQFALSVIHALCQRLRDLDKRVSSQGKT